MAKSKIAKREEVRLKEELQTKEGDIPVPTPPDGGYGWVIVFASFICNTVGDGIAFAFGLVLPYLVEYYGESKGKTAWVGSILTGFQMGAGPLVSAVANKYGCRTACLIGCFLASSSVALSTICPSIPVMMLVYGCFGGIGFSFIYIPAVVMVGYYFETKRSLATGLAVCGTGVGAFALAPLVTSLLKNYGWKTTNFCLAGITLSCSIFAMLMKPLVYENKNVTVEDVLRVRTSEGNVSNPAVYNSTLSITKRKGSVSLQPLSRKDVLYTGSVQNLKEFQSRASLADYRHSVHSIQRIKKQKPKSENCCSLSELAGLVDVSLLKDATFLILAAATVFVMIAFYIPLVFLIELGKTKGIDETQGSMFISIIGITNIIGRIGVGFIADFPSVNNLLVNNICLVMGAVSVALMPLCPNFTTLAVASLFFGFATAGYMSLTSIILVEYLGLDKLTNAFGMLMMFRGVAAAIGSPIAGTLYDITNTYSIPFFVGGAGFAIAAFISMLTPCVRKKTEELNDFDGEALTPINAKNRNNF
ncbi:monocarboxylate transporter 2-like [Diorhabda carinulata]|uniref:monocarboxylate transporter 2-like n=1 Tax=Diorhabda carinulata TaxID=1163345 RepID=UPI0025A2B430|nr:monocarboxylate transporter 2-like [Diorhabda carinulata]